MVEEDQSIRTKLTYRPCIIHESILYWEVSYRLLWKVRYIRTKISSMYEWRRGYFISILWLERGCVVDDLFSEKELR